MDSRPGNSLITINKNTNLPRARVESVNLDIWNFLDCVHGKKKKKEKHSLRSDARNVLNHYYLAKLSLYRRTMFFFIKLFGMIFLLLISNGIFELKFFLL